MCTAKDGNARKFFQNSGNPATAEHPAHTHRPQILSKEYFEKNQSKEVNTGGGNTVILTSIMPSV